jgi:hypothetical protein
MDKKSNDKVKKIIESSGNNFHSNVVKYLREHEWKVLISPYYNDNTSDKAREIDIIAEKSYEFKDFVGSVKGWLTLRLIVECKYINKVTVFWFDDKDRKNAEEIIVRDTPLRRDNRYTEKHHYMKKGKVAKLFSSEKNKDLSNEQMYKAVNQCLNAMIYFRREERPMLLQHPRNLEKICYPVIILNDFEKIYRINIGESNYSKITDKFFQMEIYYAYLDDNRNSMNEYFLIDVVDFSHMDDFLNDIETRDIESIKAMLREKQLRG